jgi:spermidine/putrescine-binding protein
MKTRVIQYLVFILTMIPPLFAFAEENVLRLLVWEGYTPGVYVQKFEEEIESKYGIPLKMDISYALTDDDFFNPIRDKKFDLITICHYSIKDGQFKYIPRGVILPLNLKNIPNYAGLIPDLKNADYDTSKGNIYGVPVANGPYGLAYNTKVFKQAPQSWKIFWNPAYKYKYSIGVEEYIYNISITAMVMGYSREMISSFDALNNKKFRDKLRQLAVNAGGFWVGVDRPEDLLGMSFAMAWGDSLTPLKRIGEKWEMVYPVEGTMWWIDEYAITWALADKPLLKKIAEEWINKSLSADFQMNHINGELRAYPVVTHIQKEQMAKKRNAFEINPAVDFSNGKRVLQHTYSPRDTNGLKLMWEKALEGVSNKRLEQ